MLRNVLIFFLVLSLSPYARADYESATVAYEVGDYETAVNEFLLLAEAENAPAQYNLGVMYENGFGVQQDYAEAVTWYRKAAVQGLPLAEYTLGFIYEKGFGVQQDYAEAVTWYRKAAVQRLPLAEYTLGWMYYDGLGVSRDYGEAMRWFRKAAEQGLANDRSNPAACDCSTTEVSEQEAAQGCSSEVKKKICGLFNQSKIWKERLRMQQERRQIEQNTIVPVLQGLRR